VRPKVESFLIVVMLSTFLAAILRSPFLGAVAGVLAVIYVYKKLGKDGLRRVFRQILGERDSARLNVSDDGFIVFGNRYAKALVVDDVPFDYRDHDDSELRSLIINYNRILDSIKDVNVVLVRQSLDKRDFLSKAYVKLQNLRVQVENDPTNERAKAEIRLLEKIIRKIEEGESPFKYKIYLIVPGATKEEVAGKLELLKSGLASIGIRARGADINELSEALFFRTSAVKVTLPSNLPLVSPFILTRYPRVELVSDGVLLGFELFTNRAVMWNVRESLNPHLLVLGPTGSGKTEFLIALSARLTSHYDVPVMLVDTKGDITARLTKYNVPFKRLNPLVVSPGLLDLEEETPELKAFAVEGVISSAFELSEEASSVLFYVLLETFRNGWRTWNSVFRTLDELDYDDSVKARIRKALVIVRELESGKAFDVGKIESEPQLFIIDVSNLSVEEAKRYVILAMLTRLYTHFRRSVDRGLRLVIVLDEAWTVVSRQQMARGVLGDIIKRGRGHGIAVFLATQNVSDFQGLEDLVLENVSNLVILSNGDMKFWEEVGQRFVFLSKEEIRNKLMYLKRGEALVRLSNDPRPLFVRLDTFVS
jgi:energy-coupling factor transporter ATP-binding protein EcfA2